MKSILIFSTLLISQSILAAPTHDIGSKICNSSASEAAVRCPSYLNECAAAALAKMKIQADYFHATLDESTLQLVDIDARVYNPWKYLWFSASATYPDGAVKELSVTTQKSFLPPKPCF